MTVWENELEINEAKENFKNNKTIFEALLEGFFTNHVILKTGEIFDIGCVQTIDNELELIGVVFNINDDSCYADVEFDGELFDIEFESFGFTKDEENFSVLNLFLNEENSKKFLEIYNSLKEEDESLLLGKEA